MKINGWHNNLRKSITVLATILFLAFTLAGCQKDKTNKNEKLTVEPEVTAEITTTPEKTEAVEPSEEPSTEPEEIPVEELSTEEWVESLNLDTLTFLVFNENAGVRKVLEEGEKYTVSDGDTLALWLPAKWTMAEGRNMIRPMELYNSFESKYGCAIFNLDDIEIEGEQQIDAALVDTEGNEVIVTAYLIR